MVDRPLIVKRLEIVDEYLGRASRIARVPKRRYVSNPDLYMLAERCLHLALEAILDIANHVVSDRELGSPESYADSIYRLAQGKIIPKTIVKKMVKWIGLRNILVHGYIKLDHGLTYDAIRKDMAVLRQYCKAMTKFL